MKDNRTEYLVTINGMDHTVLLDAEDAERYGKAARKVTEVKPEVKPEGEKRTRGKPAAKDEAPADDDELTLVE